jgi:hypothetical protein
VSWHQQHWLARRNIMGDTAEQKYESINDSLGIKYVRYGLSRPPFRVISLPRFIRYTPDYLQADRLVEVQGIGRDAILKLKVDKHAALLAWNDMVLPVEMWVWDSHRSKYAVMPLVELPIDNVQTFDDGKTYYSIPKAHLGLWQPPP